MDYMTKPTNRQNLRVYSKYFRDLFDVPHTGAFPVLAALDKIPQVFEGSHYEIVEDDKFPPKTMARCMANDDGGFTIEIKDSVYNGAYHDNTGAFLGFICHEMCHVFLFYIGFTPIFERSFANNKLPAYCSVEWQAKALCGEVMIPYDESKGMDVLAMVDKYHVSKAFAEHRIGLD